VFTGLTVQHYSSLILSCFDVSFQKPILYTSAIYIVIPDTYL